MGSSTRRCTSVALRRRRRALPLARRRAGRLRHADDAQHRRYARDYRRTQGALSEHRRAGARRHLLCDPQPPERGARARAQTSTSCSSSARATARTPTACARWRASAAFRRTSSRMPPALDPAWLAGVRRVGVTAGASAPEVPGDRAVRAAARARRAAAGELSGPARGRSLSACRRMAAATAVPPRRASGISAFSRRVSGASDRLGRRGGREARRATTRAPAPAGRRAARSASRSARRHEVRHDVARPRNAGVKSVQGPIASASTTISISTASTSPAEASHAGISAGPLDVPSAAGEAEQVRRVLEEDPHVRHRLGAHQLLVHVGLPGQPLHVRVAADADEALAPLVAEYQKHCMMPSTQNTRPCVLHEAPARAARARGRRRSRGTRRPPRRRAVPPAMA